MSKPAVFLDRDGTLIEHYDYLTDPDQVKLLPSTAKAMRQLRQRGYALVVITNQSAVARGMLTEEKLLQIHERLKSLLSEQGAYVDQIYYCPYHPEGAVERYRKDSDLRKPLPGMLLTAAEEMDLDLSASWMIGDDSRDIGAGQAAGCRTILLDSHSASPLVRRGEFEPDYRAVNLQEAANLIFHQQHKREVEAGDAPVEPEESVAVAEKQEEAAVVETPKERVDESTAKQADMDDDAKASVAVEDDKQAEAVAVRSDDVEDDDEPREDRKRVKKVRSKKKKVSADSKRSTELLAEILRELKVAHRQQGFAEFSAAKLVAGLTQMLVILFMILAFSSYISLESDPAATQNCLLAAVLFQVMTLTLLSVQKH